MIPSPWISLVLALAAFRILRLLAWDTFPPVANARARLLGEFWHDDVDYKRRTLHDLFSCAYCLGFYVSAGIYMLWVWFPTATLYVAAPFALSAVVGLIARHLDP